MSIIFQENYKKAILELVDTGSFALEEDIPLFAPHERKMSKTDEQGKTKVIDVCVKDDDLEEICQNTNSILGGYLPCITIGHRNLTPGFPETEQPPVIGFLFGLYKKHGIIWCHNLVLKNKHTSYLAHPYRSAEYVPETKVIIGMAVLTRPPFLGVGTRVAEYQAHSSPALAKRQRMIDRVADSIIKKMQQNRER